MTLMKVIELVGNSPTSWDDAVQKVVAEASESLRNITAVDVIRQTAHVANGKISDYRVTVHVAFHVEEHHQLVGTGHR